MDYTRDNAREDLLEFRAVFSGFVYGLAGGSLGNLARHSAALARFKSLVHS